MGEGLMAEVDFARTLTNIGRSPHIPWRAVKGGQGLSTLSGLASRASRPPLGRGARPSLPSKLEIAWDGMLDRAPIFTYPRPSGAHHTNRGATLLVPFQSSLGGDSQCQE
jgi:hypothetical protein